MFGVGAGSICVYHFLSLSVMTCVDMGLSITFFRCETNGFPSFRNSLWRAWCKKPTSSHWRGGRRRSPGETLTTVWKPLMPWPSLMVPWTGPEPLWNPFFLLAILCVLNFFLNILYFWDWQALFSCFVDSKWWGMLLAFWEHVILLVSWSMWFESSSFNFLS